MKNILYLLLFPLSVVVLTNCKKEAGDNAGGGNAPKVPTVTTAAASDITATSLTIGGTISSDGGASVTERGVCWDGGLYPTTANSKTVDGDGSGTFISKIANLKPLESYSFRAYATNSIGTSYGDAVLVVTDRLVSVPTLITDSIASINHNSAFASGQLTFEGNAPITAKGICWSTTPNPTTADNKISLDPASIGLFSPIDGLNVNITYYVRAYATNSVGTGYGNQVSFTTAFKIGNAYQGGRIFFVDNTKLHGLIAASTDQSGGAKWNNTSNPYSAVNAYSMSDGETNTNAMIAAISNIGNAAAVCRSYTGGGFSDWYLPSQNELNTLYLKKVVIGNFQNYFYWSSTASNTYDADAWAQDFGSGSVSTQFKIGIFFVRAIRKF